MGFFKSVKTLGTIKGMKKIGKEVGKILHPSRKVHVERSRASAFDYKYNDGPEDQMTPLLSSNKKGKSSDPESSSTGRISRKTNSDPESSITGRRSRKTSVSSNSTRDPSTTFRCGMCVKPTHLKNSFYVEGCNHLYCQQCIVDFVRFKLEINVAVIACPEATAGCRGCLEPEYCRPILPESVLNRWINALHDHNGQPSDAESETSYSSSPGDYFTCPSCAEQVHLENSFDVKGCHHFYCQPCVVNFIVSKLCDNVTSIVCPEEGCSGMLDPEYCRVILSDELFDWWETALKTQSEQSANNPETNEASTSNHPNTSNDTSTSFICDFCLESFPLGESFNIKGCSHFYCQRCVATFVLSKLEDNVTSIMCPVTDCSGVLDPDYCRLILPDELFDWWETALQSQNEASTSMTSTFICDICADSFQLGESFNIEGCSHFYCQQCIVNYISSKLQDNVTSIKCPEPGCSGYLDPEYCHPILSTDIYDRWGKALCESAITGSESSNNHFYCPFADCSALLIREDEINMSECPHCDRVVCAKCKVPWHMEFTCDEFQRLRDKGEDEMVRALAKKNKWRQCEKCKYYVEKEEGCMYIKCRCGYAFCYNCGRRKSPDYHTRYCSCEGEGNW